MSRELKNIDKIKDPETRDWLIHWNENISTVTINVIDTMMTPPFKDAYMYIKTDEDE